MSAIARSLAPFLRTSRYAVQRQRGVNPVQRVLAQDPKLARGMATMFERTKPHVNIGKGMVVDAGKVLMVSGTIGHVDHGKVWFCYWNSVRGKS